MDSLPTGSNQLIQVRTTNIDFVIKSKKARMVAITDKASSSVIITSENVEKVAIDSQNIILPMEKNKTSSSQMIKVAPLFFEQTDYEIILSSRNGESIEFWNENYQIREKVGPVIDGNYTLLTGVINFGNFVGYSNLDIRVNGKKVLVVRIEVYPSKISYKEDYQRMIADVSDMVYAAAIDFMQKTYQEFSIGNQRSSIPAIYFQLLSSIFQKYRNAVNRIVVVPNHKLITQHKVLPMQKAKKLDRKCEKWLCNHSEEIYLEKNGVNARRVMSVKKQITYDTVENRFVKYILNSTIQKIQDFIIRYQNTVTHVEEQVISDAENMIKSIRQILSTSFLNQISENGIAHSMSLVFGMAPGYRELYKYYIMLQCSLSVHGDIFHISIKDTAQLYEYWCFIKLFSILKRNYDLVSPDIIQADHSGITVTLMKGKKSEVMFLNPKTGERITLIYNPGETNTQTVNQRPDNVLELEKKGTDVAYKYVFDAKYRIETNPDTPYYPDDCPGPKIDDINTMHRYRDSIVYENEESRFTFEKTMFGAYILFPYDQEELYKQHRFYQSIEKVNIGGLPFLPGATSLVQKLLSELISDSKESAFERTTLPVGIEEKLSVVNWKERDVLIGTFRSKEQFQVCYEKLFYYIPKRQVPESKLPIHYVALYQTKAKFGSQAGIQYYGKVLRMDLVRRDCIKEMPLTRKNGDELYYRFIIKKWEKLTKPILPKETGFVCEYTNLFLLTHSEFVQELLIENEEKYRFYTELALVFALTADIFVTVSAILSLNEKLKDIKGKIEKVHKLPEKMADSINKNMIGEIKKKSVIRRLFNAFPNIRSNKYGDELSMLKSALKDMLDIREKKND